MHGRVEFWALDLFQFNAGYDSLESTIFTIENVYSKLETFAGDKFRKKTSQS